MRIEDYIEEDFRLTPSIHVRNYEPGALYVKPQLPGFAFSQLLDQINGHVLTTPRAKFLIFALGGTAYWVAKHVAPVPVHIHFEAEQYDKGTVKLLSQLQESATFVETSADPSLHVCCNVTCTIIAVPSRLMQWYDWCQTHPVLSKNLILAYDPTKSLKARTEGEYFLNSSIWVTRDYGN